MPREPTFHSLYVAKKLSLSTDAPLSRESDTGDWHLESSSADDGYVYSYISEYTVHSTHTYVLQIIWCLIVSRKYD